MEERDEGELEEEEEAVERMEEDPAAPPAPRQEEGMEDYQCTGLSHESSVNLLRACVNMIAIPVEPDALNAIMRLSLRVTRDFDLASMFAELGGIKLLLGLTQARTLQSFIIICFLSVEQFLLLHSISIQRGAPSVNIYPSGITISLLEFLIWCIYFKEENKFNRFQESYFDKPLKILELLV